MGTGPGGRRVARQVAGQQGAYVAHLVNRYKDIGSGGMEQPPPSRVTKGLVGGEKRQYYQRPFEFLSLGMMAYIGNDQVRGQKIPKAALSYATLCLLLAFFVDLIGFCGCPSDADAARRLRSWRRLRRA
eukprot:8387555-Pyramimonas_sp.AAC.1